MKPRTRKFVPIAGGQDIDEVLANINASLAALAERAEKGEDVAAETATAEAEKKRVEAAAAALKAQAAPQETELDRLRRESEERREADLISRGIEEGLKTVARSEAEAATRIQERISVGIAEALKKGGNLEQAMQAALKAPGENRAVLPGADPSLVAYVAAGGSLEGQGLSVHQPDTVSAGASVVAKALRGKKNFTFLMAAIRDNQKGVASPAAKEFLFGNGRDMKALAEGTDSAGGYLVPPDWMPDVLKLLRAQTVVRRAGPREVRFTKQMNQVAIGSGATAYWEGENAVIPTSEQTLAQATLLTPKNLTGLVPVSNWLLADTRSAVTDPDILDSAEDTVRNDLAEVMALAFDLGYLQGSGSSAQPRGLKNISGIISNPVTVPTDGISLSLPQFRQIKNRTRTLNVKNGRWAWFFNGAVLSYLEGLTDSLGRFLVDTNLLQETDDVSGRFDGVPYYISNQIPVNLTQGASSNATYLLLVNMAETIVGVNQEIEIDMSSEASYTPDGGTTWVSTYQTNESLFRALARGDIAHRYPGAGVIRQDGVLV